MAIDQAQLRPLDAPAGATHVVEIVSASEAGRVLAEVLSERARQLVAEGYSPAHDDTHDFAELARAAAAHALMAAAAAIAPHQQALADVMTANARAAWPQGMRGKAHPQRRHLVIAAALLVAELERVDREAQR